MCLKVEVKSPLSALCWQKWFPKFLVLLGAGHTQFYGKGEFIIFHPAQQSRGKILTIPAIVAEYLLLKVLTGNYICAFFCTRQSRLIKESKVRFFYKIFANFATQWVFLCSKIITTTYHRISALYKFSIIYFIIIKNWNMLRLCHVWNDFLCIEKPIEWQNSQKAY